MNDGKVHIGLVYHGFNSSNLGLDALANSHVLILHEICKKLHKQPVFYNFYLMDNEKMHGKSDYEFVDIANHRSIKLISEFKRCDIIFDLSLGDSFADIYGIRRALSMILNKFLITLSGVTYVLAPQTIGPFNHRFINHLANRILHRSKRIYVRDQLSWESLSPKLRSKAVVTTDLAFYLPYTTSEPLPNKRQRVILNVSGLLYNGGYSSKNSFGLRFDYRTLIDNLIRSLLDLDVDLCLLAHVIVENNPTEDDYRICQQLVEKYPGVTLAPKFTSAIQAKSFISGYDYFIGSRMHASIAAFSTGLPIYVISYSRKFKGLYHNIGYFLDGDTNLKTPQQIIQEIKADLAQLDSLKERVDVANSRAQALNISYMNDVISLIKSIHD